MTKLYFPDYTLDPNYNYKLLIIKAFQYFNLLAQLLRIGSR